MRHITSKHRLLLLLLGVALIPYLIISITIYTHSHEAIEDNNQDKLEIVRNLTKKELIRYFAYQHDLVEIISQDTMVKKSFMELYGLQKRSKISDHAHFPFQSKDVQKIYRKYDDYINWYIHKHNFLDLYYIEADSGQVIYSAMKDTDIGANLKFGTMKKSALAWSFYHAVRNRKVSFEDIQRKSSTTEEPFMLLSIPVIQEGKVIGVIALKLGFDKLNEIVASHLGDRDNEGLYLVGNDYRLRSNSSFEPISMSIRQSFANSKNGRIDSSSVHQGLAGKESSNLIGLNDYNKKVLSTYTPIYLFNTTWVLLSEMTLTGQGSPLNVMVMIIILGFIFLIAIILMVSRLLEGRLKRLFHQRINGLANYNQNITSQIENAVLSLTLLGNRTEDRSLVTEELYKNFEHTLSNEERKASVLKATTVLGKRVNETVTECDRKVDKNIWQLNKVEEAIKELKDQVSRLNEISLQTNIIALDADIEDDQKIDKSLVLETIAAKTKKLSLQMVQVSQDTQSFIDNTMLHIEEGKHINQNMSQLLETTKDNIYKSNQFLKKYLLADQKTQKNYQDIFHAMGSADHITEENVLGSKQVIAEMQELRTWSVMMYDDIIKIALVMGIDLKEQHIGMHTEHAFNHLSNNPDENISLMLENKEDIEHELSKL